MLCTCLAGYFTDGCSFLTLGRLLGSTVHTPPCWPSTLGRPTDGQQTANKETLSTDRGGGNPGARKPVPLSLPTRFLKSSSRLQTLALLAHPRYTIVTQTPSAQVCDSSRRMRKNSMGFLRYTPPRPPHNPKQSESAVAWDLSLLSPPWLTIDASCSSIVAIHGLNGGALRTWTTPDTGICWLSDPRFLPKYVKNSRVLVWGYDANLSLLTGDTTSKERIHHHAHTLVANLAADRRFSCHHQPPFAHPHTAHTCGGIVLTMFDRPALRHRRQAHHLRSS